MMDFGGFWMWVCVVEVGLGVLGIVFGLMLQRGCGLLILEE